MDYVNSSIEKHGWLGCPLFNACTMHLLDGHGRVKEAIRGKKKTIPVDIGWWTEEEEYEILLSLDSTTQMASVDGNALLSLSALVQKAAKKSKDKTSLSISNLSRDTASFARKILDDRKDRISIRSTSKKTLPTISTKTQNEQPGDYNGSIYEQREIKNDIVFRSSNEWGLPDIRSDFLYGQGDSFSLADLPVNTYAKQRETLTATSWYCESSRPFRSDTHIKPVGGYLGFYTQDWIFDKYYNKADHWAEVLLSEQWTAIVEPDYSTYWDRPFAERLWSLYRSRWLLRFWQELGIYVIPTIRRSNNTDRDEDLLYSTLPKPCYVVSVQCRLTESKDPLFWSHFRRSLESSFRILTPNICFIYGGVELQKYVLGQLPEILPSHKGNLLKLKKSYTIPKNHYVCPDGMYYVLINPYINQRRRYMK